MTVLDDTLYGRVAGRIGKLIEQGTLRPGQRVPSVRKLAGQLKVSVSTVLMAYQILEDRGLIEARPQSGYYVRGQFWQPPPEPEPSTPAVEPARVSTGDLIMDVLAKGRAPDIVPLGAAIPGPQWLPTAKLNRIAAAIGRRTGATGSTYDVPPGCEALRIQVARRAMEAGCALAPGEIITTSGAQEALSLCLRAVARPGDAIAIESPCYYGTLQAIEVLGMRAVEIPTHPRHGVSLDALRLALEQTEIRACLFILNFNNPLGCCVSDAAKRELVRLLAERRIPLIEDDIYGDLSFADARPKCAKAFDADGGVLLCSSFSKTLAPGYRVGWCAPGRYFEEVHRQKIFTTMGTATIPQMAIAEFLANGGYERHLRKVRRGHREQVERMTHAISRYFPQGTRVTRPAGGFVLWVELPEGVDALLLHRRALEEKISIAPGPIFSPKQRYRNCIRLNCGHPWSERIDRAVERLGVLAGQMLAGGAGDAAVAHA